MLRLLPKRKPNARADKEMITKALESWPEGLYAEV